MVTTYLHITYLLTNTLDTRDPIGSKKILLSGLLVTMPDPRGRKSLPTKFSRTLLLPALCPPTTAIWGRSRPMVTLEAANTSCSLFMWWITSLMLSLFSILHSVCLPVDYSVVIIYVLWILVSLKKLLLNQSQRSAEQGLNLIELVSSMGNAVGERTDTAGRGKPVVYYCRSGSSQLFAVNIS